MKHSRKAAAAAAAVLASSFCLPATEAYAAAVVPGDFNNDGKFTLTDIVDTLKAYANNQKFDGRTLTAVDVDKSGKIDLQDLVKLVNLYANHISGSTPNTGANRATPNLKYNNGTTLRTAIGYNGVQTGISFYANNMDQNGTVTLADGKTYRVGDLKPTWAELQNRLNIKFYDVYRGSTSAANEFRDWMQNRRLNEVDIVTCTAQLANESGAAGSLIDLSKYLNNMPNFKAFLDANPIVRLSITGSTAGSNKGAIYYAPYFDGVNDVERTPLMRTDWVEKLLNGSGSFTAAKSGTTSAPAYTPYMPTSGTVAVDVVKADGSGTEIIQKDYNKAGNIIAKMNAAGQMSGVEAVNMLRKYIDEAYDGYYGNNRADLFIGQNAAWDADELVALLRCVTANAQTLNGTDTVFGLFSRQENSNLRRVDMYRFAGSLFGARGVESRNDYLYVGADSKLHDARMETATYAALEKMNLMVKEGLIGSTFVNNDQITSTDYLKNDLGFMSYDYYNTQTIFNENGTLQDGEMYRSVMIPVARWYDGSNSNGTYMRFTESWRSVKTDGLVLSAQGIGNDQNKLNAALKLIDYAYSKDGQILMSYGPDAFIKKNSSFTFNGESWPEISDAARSEMWAKSKGNYTNYARYYLGSTLLGTIKPQAYEFQCSTAAGRLGASHISNAITLGTIKHPELKVTSNPWYTSLPTVLPLTQNDNYAINNFTELGSNGYFSTNISTYARNLFVDIIAHGYGYSFDGKDAAQTINTIQKNWGGDQVLAYRQGAWDDLMKFYKG